MSFVHPLLLGGLLLVGVPVLIHLIMRQKPKHLLFPAMRFLQQRFLTNSRKLRLRHIVLMALRILLIALVCLALGRPKLYSDRILISAGQPVAAVFIFDTTYSMEYSVAGRTRLADAQKRAGELLNELPEGSRVAVLDSAELVEEWQPTLALARQKIDELQLTHARPRLRRSNVALTRQIETAARMFQREGEEAEDESRSLPKFLYIFSDRTRASWDSQEVKDLKLPAGVYSAYIDVGVDNPRDLAITELKLPEQMITPGDRFRIGVTVRAARNDSDKEAHESEVLVRIKDETKWEPKPISLRPGETRTVYFEFVAASRPDAAVQVAGLKPGAHQVEAQLATADALPFDNTRFATLHVRENHPVLVLCDQPADGLYWQLDLEWFKRFHCDVMGPAKTFDMLPEQLEKYKIICLVNVSNPAENGLWPKLEAYLERGGNLIIVPGGQGWAPVEKAYNDDAIARKVMPARLGEVVLPPADRSFSGVKWVNELPPHRLLTQFRRWREMEDSRIDFQLADNWPRALKYWDVVPNQGAEVIISYDDKEKRPALVERAVGAGRVLLFTTAFDGQRDERNRYWNNYRDSSFARVLVNEAAGYLVKDDVKPPSDYIAGQIVTVTLPPGARALNYTLLGPGLTGPDAALQRGDARKPLEIDQAVVPGNYSVFDGDSNKVVAAFSINADPRECDLTRVDVQEIEKLLGPGSVIPVGRTVNLRDALQGRWPQPVELFPWLMILVLLGLAVENLLANRFYRRAPDEASRAAPVVPAPATNGAASPAVPAHKSVAQVS